MNWLTCPIWCDRISSPEIELDADLPHLTGRNSQVVLGWLMLLLIYLAIQK
jgi:hypothetical protein